MVIRIDLLPQLVQERIMTYLNWPSYKWLVHLCPQFDILDDVVLIAKIKDHYQFKKGLLSPFTAQRLLICEYCNKRLNGNLYAYQDEKKRLLEAHQKTCLVISQKKCHVCQEMIPLLHYGAHTTKCHHLHTTKKQAITEGDCLTDNDFRILGLTLEELATLFRLGVIDLNIWGWFQNT